MLKENSLLVLPINFFDEIQNKENKKQNFSWKKIVYGTIDEFDKLLSTNEIFHYAKVKYPIELGNRRKSIKNISS